MSSFDRARDEARRRDAAAAAAQQEEDARLGVAQADAARRASNLLPDLHQAVEALVANPHRRREAALVAAGPNPSSELDYYVDRARGTLISPGLELAASETVVTTSAGRWRTRQEARREHAGWVLWCPVVEHPLFERVLLRARYRPTGEHVMEHRPASIVVSLDGNARLHAGGSDWSLQEAAGQGIIRWITHSSSGSAEPNLVDVGATFEVAIGLVAAYVVGSGPRPPES